MSTEPNEKDLTDAEKAKIAERVMVRAAEDFLATPLAQTMEMTQANIDEIVRHMKINSLALNEGGIA